MTPGPPTWPLLTVAIGDEASVVAARQRARRLAELLGFDGGDQTRIATAVSEIVRNAHGHAGGGRAAFALVDDPASQRLVVEVVDRGRGFGDLDAVLEGGAPAGRLGGLAGARRLMDAFAVESGPGGTRVTLEKRLSRRRGRLDAAAIKAIVAQILQEEVVDPLSVLGAQNQELVRSLAELAARQEELSRLNQELGETNRGVVALYAELDARAEELRRASELKSRFLSNMSHEFRTPLNSILALSRLLLDRTDGPLTEEQERQVGYVRRSAQALTVLVDDLLDMAKVEAGKVELRPAAFTVPELFGALRGVLRPLRTSDLVELTFVEPDADFPPLRTDEAKVAQILRNVISNALKFTPSGEVRVEAALDAAADHVRFAVADTGIGIAPADQARIFEEFAQLDGPLQGRTKGTGLGLPLSRRLAELLGGEIFVESRSGEGAVFTLSVPRVLAPDREETALSAASSPSPARTDRGAPLRILVADDEEPFRYALRQMIEAGGGPYQVVEAADGIETLRLAHTDPRPAAILLDLQMPRLDGRAVLSALASDPATRPIPVIVVTSLAPEGRLEGVHHVIAKSGLTCDGLLAAVADAVGPVGGVNG